MLTAGWSHLAVGMGVSKKNWAPLGYLVWCARTRAGAAKFENCGTIVGAKVEKGGRFAYSFVTTSRISVFLPHAGRKFVNCASRCRQRDVAVLDSRRNIGKIAVACARLGWQMCGGIVEQRSHKVAYACGRIRAILKYLSCECCVFCDLVF